MTPGSELQVALNNISNLISSFLAFIKLRFIDLHYYNYVVSKPFFFITSPLYIICILKSGFNRLKLDEI